MSRGGRTVPAEPGAALSWVTAVLVLVPRLPVTYGLYVLTPVAVAAPGTWLGAQIPVFIALGISMAAAATRYDVSWTAAALEYALVLPFLMGVFGARLRSACPPLPLMRAISVVAFVASIISLVQQGFPFRLPYIHFLPDYYFAFFGLGGAKIVTMLGFFGLFAELTSGHQKRPYLVVAVLNFVMPNFLLGMVAGGIGLFVLSLRNRRLFLALTVMVIVALPYALFRVESVNSYFEVVFGAHPKLYQFVLPFEYFDADPIAVLFGTGLGQYGGDAALWVGPAGDLLSGFNRPSLPGYFAALPHVQYLAPILLRFADVAWAISSSSNKPYSSLTIMAVEFGLPLTALICAALFYRLIVVCRDRIAGAALLIFSAAILTVDVQHDSPWFGLGLIILNSIMFKRPARQLPEQSLLQVTSIA